MAKTKKTITMEVVLSVPLWMTAAQARREARSLINDQCGWLSHGPNYEDVEVRARSVRPARGDRR